MEELSFLVELQDVLSAPSKLMKEALGGLTDAMKVLQGATKVAEDGLGRAGKSMQAMLDSSGFDRSGNVGLAIGNFFVGAAGGVDKYRQYLERTAPAAKALAQFFRGFGDQAAPPVQKVNVEVGQLATRLGSVDLKKLWDGLKGGAIAGAFTFGIGAAVSTVVSGLEKALDLAVELGRKLYEAGERAVTTAARGQRQTLGLQLLAGDQGAGEIRQYLEKVSGSTSLINAEQVSQLLLRGFKPDELDRAIATALDVEAAIGGKEATISRALESFSKIKTTGKIEAEALGAFGLQAPVFFEALGKAYKTTPKGVKELIEQGKVASDDIVAMVQQQVAARGGGILGAAGVKAGATVEGLFDRLRALPDRYLSRLQDSPGFGAFQGFMQRIVDTLDPKSETGQRILRGIITLGDRILGLFSGLDDEKINGFVDSLLGVAEALIELTKFIGPAIKMLGELVRMATQASPALGVLAAPFRSRAGSPGAPGPGGASSMQAAGTSVGMGFVYGLAGSAGAVWQQSQELAAMPTKAVIEKNQIQSPSKAMARLGNLMGQGLAVGIEESGRAVEDAAAQAFGPPGAGSRPGRLLIGNISLAVEVNVQGGGQEQGRDIAERIGEVTPGMLEAAVERLLAGQAG